MAVEEEVPKVRILPPPTRPVLPEVESKVPAVRERTARPAAGKRLSTSHTIAVGDEMYARLLHAKHALEVRERRLVSFGEVIEGLIEDQNKLLHLEERIAAKKAARQAAAAAEDE